MVMRKRSSYRPRPMLRDPMGYVVESLTPMPAHGSALVDLRLRNHSALSALTRGEADFRVMDDLGAAANICEVLCREGFGVDYRLEIAAGLDALKAVKARGSGTGRFVLRAQEMDAINEMMAVHDAQLEVATVRDMERAILAVRDELLLKKHATPVVAKEKAE